MKQQKKPVFIDPTTDVGFKRLFGDKENLKNFLNIIFRGRKDIVDLSYSSTEHVGSAEDIGTVVFDLMVTTGTGEEIIIEMQTTKQTNLKERMLYYASKVISDKAPLGNRRGWGYALPEVYTIVLMDRFRLPGSDGFEYFHDICLCSRDTGDIFYEGLGFIYLELANFVKSEEESTSDLDKVFFMLKNMPNLEKLPRMFNSGVFQRFFQLAQYAKLTKEEQAMYDRSLRNKWDAEAVRLNIIEEKAQARADGLREGREEGREEGRQQGREEGRQEGRQEAYAEAYAMHLESARKMLKRGDDIAEICEILGLTTEEVEKLK